MDLKISIDDEVYNHFLNNKYSRADIMAVHTALINGTPLPKEHGRLIDADVLPLNAIDDANYGSNYIRIAPTIIEAESEEK